MAESIETMAACQESSSRDTQFFDTGCALFFEAALEEPLLALDLLFAMRTGSTEPL